MTAKVYGDLNPSEYLNLVSKVDNINMLSFIDGHLFARLCVASEKSIFITNSLGFYFIPEKNSNSILSFVIPIEPKKAIYIEKYPEEHGDAPHYLVPDSCLMKFNKICSAFERELGNGILISSEKDILESFVMKKED